MEEFPEYKNTYLLRGTIYRFSLADVERAEANYCKSLSIDPEYKEALLEYANFLHSQHRYEDLKKLVEQQMVPTKNIDQQLVFEYLGIIAEYEKRYSQAITYYKKALELSTSENNYNYYKSAIARSKEKKSPAWSFINTSNRIYTLVLISFLLVIMIVGVFGSK